MGNSNTTSLKEEENKPVESQQEKALEDPVHEDNEKAVIKPVPTDENIGDHEKSTDHNLPNSDSALTNEDNTLLSTKEKTQILPSDEGSNAEAETSPAFESEDLVNGEKLLESPCDTEVRVVPDNQETETFLLSATSCDLLGSTMIYPETLDGYGTEKGESEVPQEPNSIFHSIENEEQKETEMLSNLTAAADAVLSETDQESGERPRDVIPQLETVMDEELLLEEAELAASEWMGQANGHHKCESRIPDGTELQKKPEKEEPNQPPLEPIIGLDFVSNEGTNLESNECLHKEESFHAVGEAASCDHVGDDIPETPKANPMETDASGNESSEQFWNVISAILSGDPPETEEPASGQLMRVESDTESITTNSQMQKSPSFHLDVRPESDQTSFLYREDDGVESSPEEADHDKSLEGKTQFLGFMRGVEEKPNTIVTQEEQDHHQREYIKENISTKGKEKKRLRSSLFGTCICCGTVMNQTVG